MFDILIRGGTVIDGTGTPGYRADIGIRGGKLTVLRSGSLGLQAGKVIDAAGKYIAPGFIDAHSHADRFYGELPHSLAKASQGITTEVVGHCGCTDFPASANPEYYRQQCADTRSMTSVSQQEASSYKNYREFIIRTPKVTHIKQLASHGAIRSAVMGFENRQPTHKELEHMKALLRECMESGTGGMTSGLIYPPGIFAQAQELRELCKIVGQYGGVYTSHIRDEGDRLVESVEEALDAARYGDCRLTLSHHKAAGYRNWGKPETTLAMIDRANAAGQQVALDVYPYTASMTNLYVLLPKEEFAYPKAERVQRLRDPLIRRQIVQQLLSGQVPRFRQLRSLEDVLLITCPATPQYVGKTVAQVAGERGIQPVEALLDLLVENNFSATAAYFTMCQEDLSRIFLHEKAMVCTDALIYSATAPTHPRCFCAFPQTIDLFVKQLGLLPLEKAIYKMTALPARWYGLENKGQLQDGWDADLVIFDYAALAPGFTYGESPKLCPGIEKVLADGMITYENGQLTGANPGRLLR